MKLKDLIGAFAGEIEHAQSRMAKNLDDLAAQDNAAPAFMDALEEYTSQTQRMGEAAELAGFPGLQLVCMHVVENCLMLAAKPSGERIALINFLRDWPPLIIHYLRNLSDLSAAAGLIDYLSNAPLPLDAEQGLKIMHMLGAIPLQVDLAAETEEKQHRPVLATPEDVALVIPSDVDQNFLEGFFQEAPEQTRYLVALARNMVSGEGDSSDIIAAKRVAHTLKGSGYTIGLRGIAALGHYLEDILDYLEVQGGRVNAHVASTLLDAAYCLEQMIGYLLGNDEFPHQAQSVLQAVLDLANRIDAGESIETPVSRVATGAPAAPAPGQAEADGADVEGGRRAGAAAALPAAALRVNMKRIEELFLVSSEISVGNAAMEERIKTLVHSARDLLSQNLRVQKRLFELETVLQMRTLTRRRASVHGRDHTEFDQLEMDQYNELHSTSNALTEEAADARVLAMRLEEEIAQVASQQTHQQRLAKDLQHLVLGTRMTEVGLLESRLRRNVRSTCLSTGKMADLQLEGGSTLIDSELLNKLAEPLLHLLRNAVDHGLETPDERTATGKPASGRILLSFSRQGQQILLRCQDDGRGLDLDAIRARAVEGGLINAGQPMSEAEIYRLILLPGFSTRRDVSEVSGRGIGMDVVQEWVASMNGSITIESRPGQGCTFELRFAASLSTMLSLVVEAAGERYALPAVQVQRAVARGVGEYSVMGENIMFRLGKLTYPAVHLADLAGLPASDMPLEEHSTVIIKVNDRTQAIIVERLMDARELLVNPPGRYARHLRGVSGLSILGDGSVAVNLDMVHLLSGNAHATRNASQSVAEARQDNTPKVLIVDDSLSVRNSLSQLVRDSGFQAETARDGIDAIRALDAYKPDIILTDLEMPNMNGVELSYHVRERDDMKNMPIIMITSRSQDKHRRMAEQAGVNSYITKPYNEGELVQTIRRSIGHH